VVGGFPDSAAGRLVEGRCLRRRRSAGADRRVRRGGVRRAGGGSGNAPRLGLSGDEQDRARADRVREARIDVTAFLALSTALFIALYVPAVMRFSRGLASPYAKANVRRRFAAAAIDGLIAVTCLGFYAARPSRLLLAAAAAYLLLRDVIGGQSIGKFLFGLIVIRLENGRPCNLAASATRNAMLLLPGANIA